MSQNVAGATLSDSTNFIKVPLPGGSRWIAIIDIVGTFTGTVKIQSSTDNGLTWGDLGVVKVASTGATTGNPTGVGNFAALCGASDTHVRAKFSAYTSGSARIGVQLAPYSA